MLLLFLQAKGKFIAELLKYCYNTKVSLYNCLGLPIIVNILRHLHTSSETPQKSHAR